jgi:hypothetical protein
MAPVTTAEVTRTILPTPAVFIRPVSLVRRVFARAAGARRPSGGGPVNDAGVGGRGSFATERDLAADVATVQLNVTTLVHLTGRLLPRMLDRTGTESCGELIHSPCTDLTSIRKSNPLPARRQRISPCLTDTTSEFTSLMLFDHRWSLDSRDPAITSRRGM